MIGVIIGIIIIAYTVFILYKKSRDLKAGKSCCSGCASCSAKGKCKM